MQRIAPVCDAALPPLNLALAALRLSATPSLTVPYFVMSRGIILVHRLPRCCQPIAPAAVPDLIARYPSFLRDQEAQHLQNSNARPVPRLFSCQDARNLLFAMLHRGHYATRVLTGAAFAACEASSSPKDCAYGEVSNSAASSNILDPLRQRGYGSELGSQRRASRLDISCKLCLVIFC